MVSFNINEKKKKIETLNNMEYIEKKRKIEMRNITKLMWGFFLVRIIDTYIEGTWYVYMYYVNKIQIKGRLRI